MRSSCKGVDIPNESSNNIVKSHSPRSNQSESKLKKDSQGRPATTLHPRHRGEISHNQALLVCREALNSHALPSHVGQIRTIYGGVGLNSHRCNIVLCPNETETLSFATVLIQDKAMSGIAVGRGSLCDLLAL